MLCISWSSTKEAEPVEEIHTCIYLYKVHMGFPGGSVGEESTFIARGPDSVPEWGRFPGEGNGNPLQYYCLENSMDRGAWWATDHSVTKNQTRLSD